MENLEKYKSRFYNLMESTMGDVKPLIVEQETETWEKFMQDVLSGLSKKFPNKFVYDTAKTPTIKGGNKAIYFILRYSPTYKRAFWSSTNKNIVPEPGFIDFVVKDKTGNYVPQDPKKIQEAINKIMNYNFNDLSDDIYKDPSLVP